MAGPRTLEEKFGGRARDQPGFDPVDFRHDGRQLLPGYFVRVRVPLASEPGMLLVPDRAIGSDQSGRYVLVAGKDDVVELRRGDRISEARLSTTKRTT